MESPEIAEVSSYLGSTVRLEASDGRVFVGAFMCMDKEKNVILSGAEEFNSADTDGLEERRYVGLVMLPGAHLVSFSVENYA
ncbi:hypothetical protein CcCBS67573_g08570 [Chytriomyces confervae]|uniref:Sm domain-containing protein n=1 Tax=Chytriomyces confervae TaxID=246404 RepID=A0A507EKK1_9FUNG|nr:hypothetical protein HDU80_001377 [Chytriomyces hyalinus]TPX63836.1 hypothetical protein CcCBS67573_g08570 [Chytriomyces confervae]